MMTERSSLERSRAEIDDARWLAWQNLNLYIPTLGLDLHDWGQQFIARHRLLNADLKNVPFLENFVRDVREAPLNIPYYNPAIWLSLPIRDMSHEDVRAQAAFYAMPPLKEAADTWDAANAHHTNGERLVKAMFFGGTGLNPVRAHRYIAELERDTASSTEADEDGVIIESFLSIAFIGVDLSQSNDVLIDAFRGWLEGRRKLLSEAKMSSLVPLPPAKSVKPRRPALKLTKKAMKRWVDHRVLAYVDILLMCRFEGRDIPASSAIGEHLFPEKANPGEFVLKEVSGLARFLTSADTAWRVVREGQAIRNLRS